MSQRRAVRTAERLSNLYPAGLGYTLYQAELPQGTASASPLTPRNTTNSGTQPHLGLGSALDVPVYHLHCSAAAGTKEKANLLGLLLPKNVRPSMKADDGCVGVSCASIGDATWVCWGPRVFLACGGLYFF